MITSSVVVVVVVCIVLPVLTMLSEQVAADVMLILSGLLQLGCQNE